MLYVNPPIKRQDLRNIKTISSAPFSWLFPKCGGVIHHGGAGTTATALYAGVPQVVMFVLGDQCYNGSRMHKLGLAPAPVSRAIVLMLASSERKADKEACVQLLKDIFRQFRDLKEKCRDLRTKLSPHTAHAKIIKGCKVQAYAKFLC